MEAHHRSRLVCEKLGCNYFLGLQRLVDVIDYVNDRNLSTNLSYSYCKLLNDKIALWPLDAHL